jgi:gamma-glutamyl hercynylcysteine S-oxide synthase
LGVADSNEVVQSQTVETRQEIRGALEQARARTEELLAPVSDENLVAEMSASQLPLVWALAGIAYFEELWLLRNLNAQEPVAERHDEFYGSFRVGQRAQELPPLRPAAARAYAADVRERALDALEEADLDGSPLLRKGFVFGLVLQHELQHQETMLETLESWEGEYPHPDEPTPDVAPAGPPEVRVREGSFVLGAMSEPWAYDNELVPHEVEVRPFWIDRTPVTNTAFAEFVEDGGYASEAFWTSDGWAWLRENEVSAPLYWRRGADGWERRRFGLREQLPPDQPVQHVGWYEADAFARWAGKRLPTETEWERAAGWDERLGKSRYPWGSEWMGYEANLGHSRFSPAPAGSYAGGESPNGCLQMAGDVWEWTSSFFHPYPGFVAFPHAEYSEIFFGEECRVLRGGSWATDAIVARTSFRRWDVPIRRDLFAGFRCARDG